MRKVHVCIRTQSQWGSGYKYLRFPCSEQERQAYNDFVENNCSIREYDRFSIIRNTYEGRMSSFFRIFYSNSNQYIITDDIEALEDFVRSENRNTRLNHTV